MVSNREIQILIVGAGIGGLSLAGFFQQTGVQPVVIETDEEFNVRSGVIELWPEATRLLEQLDAADDIRGVGTVVTEWSRRRPDGTIIDRLKAEGSGGFVAVSYERLREQLAANLRGESIQMGTALRSLDASERPVAVTFENGVREEFDLVIGADGARSRTRELLGGPASVCCGTRSWVFPLPRAMELAGASEIWASDGRVFRALPAGDRPMAWLTVPRERTDIDEIDPMAVTEALTDIDWLPSDALGEIDTREVWSDDDLRVPSDTWSEGRVALVGDAAHARHRLTGVGPTLAIEDAAVLVSELVDREGALSARLSDYAARRRARIQRLSNSSEGGGPLDSVDVTPCNEQARMLDVRGERLEAAFGPGRPQPVVGSHSPWE